jgi:tripartite-type tricarboxylate transporter receptor subunit TctC
VLARIQAALAAVLALPDTRKLVVAQGFQRHLMPADKFAAYTRAERLKRAKLVKKIGIKPQ